MADSYFLWEAQFGIHSSQCLNSQVQTDINVFAVDCFSFFETKMQTEKAVIFLKIVSQFSYSN